jgi:hypothetical protein
MKCLVSLPAEIVGELRHEKETGPGYQIVSVELEDGRRFDQVVVSEGCIIAVSGCTEVPFQSADIAKVKMSHKFWNFRRWCEPRQPRKRAAFA